MSIRLALLLSCLVSAAACTTGPHNGTTTDAPSVVGKTFLFQGFYNQPGAVIKLQVLDNPQNNPATAANWVQFATATTEDDETWVNSSDPLYYWSVTAAPVPNVLSAARWPQGGVARVRAIHVDGNGNQRVLTTFDEVTFNDCFTQQYTAGADWATIGTKCAGLGAGTTTLVSTTNVPVPPGNAASFQALGFLGRKGKISEAETSQYYATIQAPPTLNLFKAKYGFPGSEVTATYYNDGDLGLGREMHCKTFATALSLIGVACYVTNYSGKFDATGKGIPAFAQDPNTVLSHAIAKQHAFATVAMVYEPPAQLPNSVKFIVYGADGTLATTAQLDNTKNNTSIPNNCLACHGISSQYNSSTNVVSNAEFLPFDPFSFKYSTQAGFTLADQADKMRRLNALVRLADPAPAIAEYIDGLYAPKAVTDSTAVANPSWVPDDWANANGSLDGTAIYTGVVRVGCRTCHMSSANPNLDFADANDFSVNIAAIRNDVCGSPHIMPHAEHVMKKFWTSGARAYLVTGYGPTTYPDALQACKP